MQAMPVRAGGISLRKLLPEAQFFGARDITIGSCAADSRTAQPGDLFVALTGSNHDGHDFVPQAVARGVTALLAERQFPMSRVPCCVVPDTYTAYGRVCQALAGNPSEKLKVIGVTGTNGKTTTTCLIASILQAAGYQPGLIGTLGYCDGLEIGPATLTTPTAPVLATWLARMAANGCTHAVVEVSSHALSQSRIAGVSLDAACVTNVRRDHLDFHNTLQNYRSAKARLFDHLAPEGFAVLNVDDPVSHEFLRLVPGPALTVGIDAPAEVGAMVIERCSSEQTFLLTAGNETVPVRTRMIGDHHVSNCLVAAATGLIYGIDLPTVARGIEAVTHVPGRLERIDCGQSFPVFVDYAHTPDALFGVLKTLRESTSGQLICVFGAGGDRDRRKRPLMAAAVESQADVAVVTTDNPRGEDPQDILDQIVEGFGSGAQYRVIGDRAEAIHWALSTAQPGDCVLIAGKGHEDYQIIGRQRYWFDDREVARQWLYARSTPHDLYVGAHG